MEILISIISFLILIILVIFPVVLFKKLNRSKFKFLSYLVLGIIITVTITLIMSWWSYKSTEILLSHYGYNFDAMSKDGRYLNVSMENIQNVKSLEISRNGIGWPAKVMIIYPFYFVYLLLVYLVMNLIRKDK